MAVIAGFLRWRSIYRRAALLGLAVGSIALSASAADDPPKRPTPEQIREKMARVRADLVRRRAETGGADRPAPGADKALNPGPLIGGRARSRPQKPPQYHFTQGQSFAYSVDVTAGTEGSGRVESFRGTPYVNVKSVDRAGDAELFVIAKLACFTTRPTGADESTAPRKTVWLGSRIALNSAGGQLGKADVNAKALPAFFGTLGLDLKRILFPEMPRSVPTVDDSSGNASLLVMGGPQPFSARAFGDFDGTVTRTKHADPIAPPFVRLTQDVLFQTKAGAKSAAKIDYRSSARFDRDRGLLHDFDATFRQEQDGLQATVASIRVRLLEGEALRAAYVQALAEWEDHPDELEPFELNRVRVDAFLPTSIQTTGNATPGMEVIHLRGSNQSVHDADNKYYLAEILEADSAPYGQVKIRYKGSNEVLAVHPGTLAFPPGPDHPDRRPRPSRRP